MGQGWSLSAHKAALCSKRVALSGLSAVMVAAVRHECSGDELQGRATAEDLAGPVRGPEPPQRGAWMTELPEERRPNAVPSQKAQVGVQRGHTYLEVPVTLLCQCSATRSLDEVCP